MAGGRPKGSTSGKYVTSLLQLRTIEAVCKKPMHELTAEALLKLRERFLDNDDPRGQYPKFLSTLNNKLMEGVPTVVQQTDENETLSVEELEQKRFDMIKSYMSTLTAEQKLKLLGEDSE